MPAAAPEKVAQHAAWQKESKDQETKLTQWLQDRGRASGKVALADVGRYLQVAYRVRVMREQKRRWINRLCEDCAPDPDSNA